MKRIILETTDTKKQALEKELKSQGKTITEWFHEKIDETVEEPLVQYKRSTEDTTSLIQINDSEEVFQRLSKLDWSFTDEDTSYLTHNIHPYPAKYIPQIPNTIIKLLSLPGEVVWDPFGGSGTTALEALLLGRQAISSDINPITEIIGKAKCTTLTPEQEELILSLSNKLNNYSKSRKSFNQTFDKYLNQIEELTPLVPNQEKWFEANQWKELSFIKWSVNKLTDSIVKNLLFAFLSKIIVRVSNQDSETRYVSKVNILPEGKVLDLYVREIKNSLPKLRQAGKLLNFRVPRFITMDLRKEINITPNSVDLVVTSPPYPNATDYHLYHRFRIFWMGHNPVDLAKKEIGSHLRHQKEKNGMRNIWKRCTYVSTICILH